MPRSCCNTQSLRYHRGDRWYDCVQTCFKAYIMLIKSHKCEERSQLKLVKWLGIGFLFAWYMVRQTPFIIHCGEKVFHRNYSIKQWTIVFNVLREQGTLSVLHITFSIRLFILLAYFINITRGCIRLLSAIFDGLFIFHIYFVKIDWRTKEMDLNNCMLVIK